MFWEKMEKKKKISPRFIHPEFGELVYGYLSWDMVSKFSMALWDKTYDVKIDFELETNEELEEPEEPEKPSQLQEEAFREFVCIAAKQKDKIEQIILKSSNRYDNTEEIYGKMVPDHVEITPKGECVLFLADIEAPLYGEGDYNEDFGDALVLIPGWLYMPAEDMNDMLFDGNVSEWVKKYYKDSKKYYEKKLSHAAAFEDSKKDYEDLKKAYEQVKTYYEEIKLIHSPSKKLKKAYETLEKDYEDLKKGYEEMLSRIS